jgi:hypothetical protein
MMKKLIILVTVLTALALPASASQYDFGTINPTTTSGSDLATLLGSWRTALNTIHSGSARPSYATAGTVWLDTTSGSLWLIKQYDGSSDAVIGSVNTSTHKYTPYFNGAAAAALTGEAIGQGLEDDGAGNLRVKLDASTLARSASGMKIATGGVGATELASTAVTAGSYTNASLTVDADGRLTAASSGGANVVRGYIDGLIISNNSGTPNTKVDIAAGVAADDTNTVMIVSSGVLTVNFGATGANGLDTGSIAASKWYHIWAIAKSDGTVAGFANRDDLTGLAPTLPSGYSYKRRIGSVLTDGSSHILSFKAASAGGGAMEVFWGASVFDYNSTLTTSRTSIALTAPPGVSTRAIMNAQCSNAGVIIVTSLDQPDEAPSDGTATPLNTFRTGSGTSASNGLMYIRTNTSRQIGARASVASMSFKIATLGFVDLRGH